MNDMTAAIAPKSDQINADDLIPGPMTVTVTDVKIVGGTEQPVSMGLAGMTKVYRPCKSMSRVLVAAWGADAKAYAGRSMTLYRDPTVKWGGMAVGGIRISHMSHIDKELTLMLTMTKAQRAPHKVRKMEVSTPADAKPDATETAATSPDAFTQDEARTVARNGTDAFRAWFKANPDKRPDANPIMDELKQLCADADKAASEADNPFGLPPAPTQAEIDAAMAEAEAAANETDK